jgi:hypothetical protein
MDKFAPYAEAFKQSSNRTRSVYYIIVAFCVISVVSFLNSYEHGWMQSRKKLAKNVYAHIVNYSTETKKEIIPKDNNDKNGLAKTDIENTKEFITSAKLQTYPEAKSMMENAFRHAASGQTVQIPLFGIGFDVNDLGFVAGISLTVLFTLLKYALTREKHNLCLAIEVAKHNKITPYAYDVLSFNEVLHRTDPFPLVNATTEEKQKSFKERLIQSWIDAPVVLLFLPLIIYILLLLYDISTYSRGFLLSPVQTWVVLISEIVFTILLAFLTVSCLLIILRTRADWGDLLKMATEQKNKEDEKKNESKPKVQHRTKRGEIHKLPPVANQKTEEGESK